MEIFSKGTAFGTKEPRPKVGGSIIAELANKAKQHENSPDDNKTTGIPSRLAQSFRNMKAFTSHEPPTFKDQDNEDDESSGSSDETESSDSSTTRVEQQETINKRFQTTKAYSNAEAIDPDTGSKGQGNNESNEEQTPKKARAKVSANMILSDLSSPRQVMRNPQHQQYGDSHFNPEELGSEMSRGSDPGRNNMARRSKAYGATTIIEEPETFKRTNFSESYSQYGDTRKVSFDSNSDSANKSDLSWGSDPGQNGLKRTNARSNTLEENSFRRTNSQWTIPQDPQHEVRSEIGLRRDKMHVPLKPKSKSAVEYNNNHSRHMPNHQNTSSTHSSTNSYTAGNSKSWSDVAYRTLEMGTEVSHRSDPGPAPHRRPTVKVDARVQLPHDFKDYNRGNQSRTENKQKPKVYSNAMMDVTDFQENRPKRKVTAFAQINTGKDDIYHPEIGGNWQDPEDEDESSEDTEREEQAYEASSAEEDKLSAHSSDPKIRQKIVELETSNESLLTKNNKLETTVKEQSARIEQLISLESVVAVQQQQIDHMSKVEDLMQELSSKLSSQETEIQNLRGQLMEDKSSSKDEEQPKMSIFYNPRLLPLNSLPRIIFDRVYDDVTILLAVVTSLIYTIYLFPVIVVAKSAKELADSVSTPKTNNRVNDPNSSGTS